MPRLIKTLLQQREQEAGGKPHIIWDSEVKGFGARIQPKGIAFILNYRHGPVERRMTLGMLGEMTVDAARRRAAQLKLAVRAGADPLGEIKERRQAAKGATVKDIAERWQRAHFSEWAATTSATYQKVLAKNIIPQLGERILAEISRAQWSAILADIADRSPAVSGLARRALGSMCSWAKEQGLLEAVDLPKRSPKLAPRARVVTDAEIQRIWAAADALEPHQQALTRFVVLSVVRSAAAVVTRREWLQGNAIVYPGETVGLKRRAGHRDQHHKVFLSEWALQQIEPALSGKSPLLFSDRPTPINPTLVLAALRKACGIDDWEFHDLRRSVRSWMAKHGISRDAAETCLGHKVIRDETERAYLVHSFEREAECAFHAWQAHVEALVTAESKTAGNVIAFKSEVVPS